MDVIPNVDIYTDGACAGNPGPGGWGAILMSGEYHKEICGNERYTTNNRMELTAVIEALQALKRPCNVQLYTDSKYVVDAITKGWVYNWKANNWLRSNKQMASNVDLWTNLLKLLEVHIVTLHWVKGHASNEYNNRCDELAVQQRLLLQ